MKLNQLNLNSLLHFHAIAKHRSLSRAALELHLSAPAVTHSLNNLESLLNQKLCLRSRSGFQLTPAGFRLYTATQNIVTELDQFSRENDDAPQHFSGILSIGILDHFENTKMENILCKVLHEFPKTKLNLQSYDSSTMNELLLNQELELGFGTFSTKLSRLKYIKIGEESLKYYVSKNHPLWKKKVVTIDDLTGQKTTWLDNHNRSLSDLETNIFIENLKYKMQFYAFSNNLSAAVQILKSGHAIVPLPENFGDRLAKTLSLKKLNLLTKTKNIDEYFVYNPNAVHSPIGKKIIESIRD